MTYRVDMKFSRIPGYLKFDIAGEIIGIVFRHDMFLPHGKVKSFTINLN